MRPTSLIDRRVWASVQEKDVLRNQRIVEGMRAELGDPNSAGGWTIKLKVGRQSLTHRGMWLCLHGCTCRGQAARRECSLGGTARLHALHALAALQMHQPATAELIRKTDEQTEALLRQKKLLQAMACFHPPPALRGAPASAGPGGSDGRARVCEPIPLHWPGAPGTESGIGHSLL